MEFNNIVVCSGGVWEQVEGALEYVPVNCKRRATSLRSNMTYADMVNFLTNRFGFRNITRLSYKQPRYVFPVDLDDDHDVSMFFKHLSLNLEDTFDLYVVENDGITCSVRQQNIPHVTTSNKNIVIPDLNTSINAADEFEFFNDHGGEGSREGHNYYNSHEPPTYTTSPSKISNTSTTTSFSSTSITKKIFKNKTELKVAVGIMALNENFQFKVTKSSTTRFDVVCNSESCDWILRSRAYNKTDAFHITSFHNKHTCSRTQLYPNNRNANKMVLGHYLKEQLQGGGRIYRGNDIVNDIKLRFNTDVSYKQAWRGKQFALSLLYNSPEESFAKLPIYFYNLEKVNPGTVTHILRDDLDRFEMCYVAVGAAIRSFNTFLRPILIIDGAHLKGAFKGTMFIAVAMDGNNQIVPIAYGIGKTESGESWTWFLSKLRDCVGERTNLAIISDRAASIDLAVRNVFPQSFHGLCCRHLMVNLRLRTKHQQQLWWATCKAYNRSIFEENLNLLCRVRPEALDTLTSAGYEKWSRAYCPVSRWNIMTSNSAESINALSVEARKLPITKLIDFFIERLQKWFYDRRELGETNKHVLTTWAANKVQRRIAKGRNWPVKGIDNNRFEVNDGGSRCLVNIRTERCTCRKWQLSGLPCGHVIAVSKFLKHTDCYHWAQAWFHQDVHNSTYAQPINPVPDESEWEVPENFNPLQFPFMDKRQAGRPKANKRIPSQGEEIVSMSCSRCHGRGHNRDTCKTPLTTQLSQSNRDRIHCVDAEDFQDYVARSTTQCLDGANLTVHLSDF